MTNKEGFNGHQRNDVRVVGIMAVHLVSQVLDEAYIIANAAKESGHPGRYLNMIKSIQGHFAETDGSIGKLLGNEGTEDNITLKLIATSTPQKDITEDKEKDKKNVNFIGQGDINFDMKTTNLCEASSSSILITRMFDISNIEQVIESTRDALECSEINDIEKKNDTSTLIKIMQSYVNEAFDRMLSKEIVNKDIEKSHLSVYNNSCNTYLIDGADKEREADTTYCIDNSNKPPQSPLVELKTQEPLLASANRNYFLSFENAYLSLNQDYEQESEEDVDAIVQDCNSLSFHDVQLVTQNTSKEDLATSASTSHKKLKENTTGTHGRRGTLMRRCRMQGARLFSCLRGWWRRGSKRKHDVSKNPGHLSPTARCRTSSLLEKHRPNKPSVTDCPMWKFNTVNESRVKSSHWKEYVFDVNHDPHAEF